MHTQHIYKSIQNISSKPESKTNKITSGKHGGRLSASLGSLERSRDLKDVEMAHLSGDRYIISQRQVLFKRPLRVFQRGVESFVKTIFTFAHYLS